MALFRVDFSGRGELSERQQKLAQMLSKLSKLSEEYNVWHLKSEPWDATTDQLRQIAVLMTNQVQCIIFVSLTL